MLWLGVGGVVMAAILTLCCAALVEIFRQLDEVRSILNLDDRAIPIKIQPGEFSSSAIGLPKAIADLPDAVIVFLSARCATCHAIAQAFEGGAPGSVWFVLSGDTTQTSEMWTYLRNCRDRVSADPDERIARRIGLNVTPAVLTAHWGQITRARAVSSSRQVLSLVPDSLSSGLERDERFPAPVIELGRVSGR